MTANFNKGDKVRYIGTGNAEWLGAEGIVTDNTTYLTLIKLTKYVNKTYTVGKEAHLYPTDLELVEKAWRVGDIVEFWDKGNDHWQGGRGKVVSTPETNGSEFVRVEITERIPLNELYGEGNVVGVYPEGLRVPKLATWNSELGTNRCNPATPCDNCKVAEEVVEETPKEAVNHPAHYGGDTTYEVIKVAEAWGLDKDAYLFNVLKYIARAGKKGSKQEDLQKADFYLDRRIAHPLEV